MPTFSGSRSSLSGQKPRLKNISCLSKSCRQLLLLLLSLQVVYLWVMRTGEFHPLFFLLFFYNFRINLKVIQVTLVHHLILISCVQHHNSTSVYPTVCSPLKIVFICHHTVDLFIHFSLFRPFSCSPQACSLQLHACFYLAHFVHLF